MHDLVLVGGGMSSASVLMRLSADRGLPPGSSVVLVDPAGETGGGAAYHRSVHPALLLNDPVARVDRTGLGFGRWLASRAPRLLVELGRIDDPRVVDWLRSFGDALAAGDVASLYAPRHLFGTFVRERFAQASRELAANGVSVSVIAASVTGLRPEGSHWLVSLDDRLAELAARAVVLGVGGPVAPASSPLPSYFRGVPGLDLAAVEAGIVTAGGGDILLLGAAASAVEMVYCIEAAPRLRRLVGRVVAISPSGRLPDGLPSEAPVAYLPARLREGHATAHELLRALEADVVAGRELGLTVPDIYPAVHAEFIRVFEQLPVAERKCMVDVYSRIYLSLLRKTSTVYAAGARRLVERGKLVNVAGRVDAVAARPDGFEVTVAGAGTFSGRVVLDCRGFGRLATDPFVGELVRAGVVQANDSGLGLRVDAGFEAAPGLAVLGPLLAGTAQGGEYIWHLEDIPRIYAYADRIAATVGDRLRRRSAGLAYAPRVA